MGDLSVAFAVVVVFFGVSLGTGSVSDIGDKLRHLATFSICRLPEF
jgi:hypothetical protein